MHKNTPIKPQKTDSAHQCVCLNGLMRGIEEEREVPFRAWGPVGRRLSAVRARKARRGGDLRARSVAINATLNTLCATTHSSAQTLFHVAARLWSQVRVTSTASHWHGPELQAHPPLSARVRCSAPSDGMASYSESRFFRQSS
jgi:hypothetical protein